MIDMLDESSRGYKVLNRRIFPLLYTRNGNGLIIELILDYRWDEVLATA